MIYIIDENHTMHCMSGSYALSKMYNYEEGEEIVSICLYDKKNKKDIVSLYEFKKGDPEPAKVINTLYNIFMHENNNSSNGNFVLPIAGVVTLCKKELEEEQVEEEEYKEKLKEKLKEVLKIDPKPDLN